MWKIAVGFIVFAALALYMLSKGGDIDMGGEKHGQNLSAPRMLASISFSSTIAPEQSLAI